MELTAHLRRPEVSSGTKTAHQVALRFPASAMKTTRSALLVTDLPSSVKSLRFLARCRAVIAVVYLVLHAAHNGTVHLIFNKRFVWMAFSGVFVIVAESRTEGRAPSCFRRNRWQILLLGRVGVVLSIACVIHLGPWASYRLSQSSIRRLTLSPRENGPRTHLLTGGPSKRSANPTLPRAILPDQSDHGPSTRQPNVRWWLNPLDIA